ncbi:hypothetical protein SNEBB_000104 [Seison nebaliae]|nr:hypothetical protein SNEBB_000104 [Seison nebaliae]
MGDEVKETKMDKVKDGLEEIKDKVNFEYIVAICIGFCWMIYLILSIIFNFVMDFLKEFLFPVFLPIPRPEALDKYDHNIITLTNGHQIHFVEGGKENSEIMIFVHGFPECWYSWRHQLDEFQKTHHVYAIDQRGYGESDQPTAIKSYRMKYLIEDIHLFIKDQCGESKPILIGHDWGGGVCWEFSEKYPNQISSLIIMNCPHPLAFRENIRTWKQFLKSWYIFFFQIPVIPEKYLQFRECSTIINFFHSKEAGLVNKKNFDVTEDEIWRYYFARPNALTGPINYYRAALKYGKETKEKIYDSPLTDKILIIWGKNDLALDISLAHASYDAAQELSKNCQLRFIENASHWVQQDTPEQVNGIIKDFIQ